MKNKITFSCLLLLVLLTFIVSDKVFGQEGAQDLIKFDGKDNWKNPSKWGFKDAQGKIIVAPKYDDVSYFNEGLTIVRLNDKYGYVDKTGKEVTPIKYNRAYDFNGGIAGVCICRFAGNGNGFNTDDDKWGAIDKTGKEIIPLKYHDLKMLGDGLVLVGNGGHWTQNLGLRSYKGKYGFIDKTGKEVTALKYDYVVRFDDDKGLIRVSIGGRWFEGGGQMAMYISGYYMNSYRNDGRWGFVDKTGKEITPLKYDYIDILGDRFSQGLYAVHLNGKYGYIDKTGKEVIPLKYDEAETFYEGRAKVRLGDRIFYIDKMGNE